MKHTRAVRARAKIVSKLPVTGELLRGSLLERTVRKKEGCAKCARGEGHRVFVLTVSYPGGRTRQFGVRRERAAEMRRRQISFGDGLIAEEVSDLREAWMTHADQVVADEQIVLVVYEALGKRHPQSRQRGRRGNPAEMVLRLMILKHVRNWSYQVLEREVRANLVYRDFTRVGGGKMPDAKTMGRWGVALGPEVLKQIHERMVEIAREEGVVAGRRMRVDTTVVETNIHYPTDSSLLGDGVRVLIRTMKK